MPPGTSPPQDDYMTIVFLQEYHLGGTLNSGNAQVSWENTGLGPKTVSIDKKFCEAKLSDEISVLEDPI